MKSAAALFILLIASAPATFAQSAQLVFTAPLPERTTTDPDVHASPAIEERGLALWAGTATDFGALVAVSTSGWTVRGTSGLTPLNVDGHDRSGFQQFELLRPVLSIGSTSIAGGGGVRQEWDGTQVFIGRVLGGSDLGGGRLQGSLVVERAVSSPIARDAADVVTSVGWSRPVSSRITFGFEGIGQDLEGLWDSAEADGGAKLLVGPSVHAHSARGTWSASVTAGPVVQTVSTAAAPRIGGRRYGLFAAGTWMPALHR